MPQSKEAVLGINSWLEDELFHQYQFDRNSLDEGWSQLFQGAPRNGELANPPNPPEPPVEEPPSEEPPRQEPPGPEPVPQEGARAETAVAKRDVKALGASEQLIPLRGAAARIAENMTASLSIPVATSQRQVPVRVIEENRNLINRQRALDGRGKLSFTHLIAWAIVKAVKSNPALKHAYAENGGEAFRAVRSHVNIGLAIDVAGKDGTRSIKVPNVKNADDMNFRHIIVTYDD